MELGLIGGIDQGWDGRPPPAAPAPVTAQRAPGVQGPMTRANK